MATRQVLALEFKVRVLAPQPSLGERLDVRANDLLELGADTRELGR